MLQPGHRTREKDICGRQAAVFEPPIIYHQTEGNLETLSFIGERLSLFRVTRSTGTLLAIVKAGDPLSALESYARMRGHLSFARFASACGLRLADAQTAFLTQEVRKSIAEAC